VPARRRILVTFATAVATLSLGVTTMGASAYAAGSTFQTPAYAGDFPDPSVMLVGGTYWAYSTGSAGRNLQVISSPDLKTWSGPTDPLPVLPQWASSGLTWAPDVIQIGTTFVMYYTVRDTALGMQCISVATSNALTGPAGPFVDSSSGPLVCQTSHGGSIDPSPFLDPASGNLYLVWKSDDNSIGQTTHLWGQLLAPGGLALAPGSSPVLLLSESASWQAPAIEGPALVRNGSTYYLFYGANSWNSASSGIGYATSRSVLGGYVNQSVFAHWIGSTANATGPQGPMVFTDTTGATRMAFAAWYGPVGYQNGGVRALWIGNLGFKRFGTPSLS
jgi:beta-xylosidase